MGNVYAGDYGRFGTFSDPYYGSMYKPYTVHAVQKGQHRSNSLVTQTHTANNLPDAAQKAAAILGSDYIGGTLVVLNSTNTEVALFKVETVAQPLKTTPYKG